MIKRNMMGDPVGDTDPVDDETGNGEPPPPPKKP